MIELEKDLDIIAQLFDFEGFMSKKMNTQQVKRYFQMTAFLYRRFHSKQGAMHFPLYTGAGEKQHHEALHTQANYISQIIEKYKPSHITELGCGMGFNSLVLAKRYPRVLFKGLDPSLAHLRFARKEAQMIENLSYAPASWGESAFWSSPMDLLYAVESFCYASNLPQVMQQIAQKLSPEGHLLIFDAFTTDALKHGSASLRSAVRLSAAAFAVSAWHNIEEVIQEAEKQGLALITRQDLSTEAMPNLRRFQQDTRALFYKKWFRYLLKNRLIPEVWIGHLIGGLLGLHTIGSEAQGYYYLHFKKKS